MTVHPLRRAGGDWRIHHNSGRMRSTGVVGGMTGRGADLLIIDDPIKDAVEASSPVYRNRAWDQRRSGGDPDWTVGAKLARAHDGRIFIEDIIRVQKSPADVERLILQTARLDGHEVIIREEQEGGSSGVAVIASRKKKLAGYNYMGQKALGKPHGWIPMLIQAEVGNVFLFSSGPEGWNLPFLAEVADAPHGSHDDQLDAVCGAFHYLSIGSNVAASEFLKIGGGRAIGETPRLAWC